MQVNRLHFDRFNLQKRIISIPQINVPFGMKYGYDVPPGA